MLIGTPLMHVDDEIVAIPFQISAERHARPCFWHSPSASQALQKVSANSPAADLYE